MDHSQEHELPGDLSALAWVSEELRRTLDTAHKSLRRHLRDLELRPTVSPSMEDGIPPALQQARVMVHQAVGALEMICLPAAARCLRASEQALVKLSVAPTSVTPEAVNTLERASFALLDYLHRVLAGQPVNTLAMFPQYRAVLALAGVDRVHPADLWVAPPRTQWPSVKKTISPLQPDARVHAAVESGMLDAMRGGEAANRRMSRLFAGLAAGASGPVSGLWNLTSAFFDAQAGAVLKPDVYTQRMVSRLLAHLRAVERGSTEAPERLLHDLQFFCARSDDDAEARAPQLVRVRKAFELPLLAGVDYTVSPLGRYDPALVPQARRRVAAFKDIWAVAADGDAAVLPACAEQAVLVADSVRQLYPDGERLGHVLHGAVSSSAATGRRPAPELAMEVATALLCIDASLEELNLDRPETSQRISRLADRISGVLAGQPPEPIEPWMETLYREVSDRQTMGSVVQELRASLAEVEQQLDRYSRQPDERELLLPVPAQLTTMRGVLSVLGLGPAAQAVLRMREDVDVVLAGADGAQAATARLADNLGGLSFLIDMLGVQPHLAKSLFRFDADTGRFSAVMGRGPRPQAPVPTEPQLMERVQALADTARSPELSHDDLSRQLDHLANQAEAADEPQLAETVAKARDALAEAEGPASRDAARADLAQAFSSLSEASQPAAAPAALAQPAPGDDDDMREIFFEEAAEVVAQAREAMGVLEHEPRDLEAMTAVRRAFHTLKGSSRMVGLREFGDAAWACEQLYNARLALADAAANAELRGFTAEALNELATWVEVLTASGGNGSHDGLALAERAHSLRNVPVAQPDPDEDADVLASMTEPEASEASDLALHLELDTAGLAAPVEAPLPLLPDVAELEPSTADWLIAQTARVDQAELADGEADLADLPVLDGEWPAVAAQDAPEVANLPEGIDFELDLADLEPPAAPVQPDEAPPAAAAPPAAEPENLLPPDEAERYKVVGPLRIPITLFNIFLNEADEQSRRLCVDLAEWQHELERPVSDAAVALAHSLAGNSATVGYTDLSGLARRLEHALERSHARGHGLPEEGKLFQDVADEVRRLLHQFAAGFLHPVPTELNERLAAQEAWDASHVSEQSSGGRNTEPDYLATNWADETALGELKFTTMAQTTPAAVEPVEPRTGSATVHGMVQVDDLRQNLDAVDAIDPELFDIFVEEALELLPALALQLRQWEREPRELGAGVAAMRSLHTLKGGARLAGAMRLGEMSHRLETSIESLIAHGVPDASALALLHNAVDALAEELQGLLAPATVVAEPMVQMPTATPVSAPAVAPISAPSGEALQSAGQTPEVTPPPEPVAEASALAPVVAEQRQVDWQHYAQGPVARPAMGTATSAGEAAAGATVRVRAPLLDRLVNHAGEVGIARSRIETDVTAMRGQLRELTDNLERLRRQLRDLELQAETQMTSRMEAARHAHQAFDPLEMDRFTRVQELTRMMAESVSDVGTVQRSLQLALQTTEDQLAAQARLTRDLQDDLLRARMVEFDTVSDRLYRVVRQAAKETGKQVRLNLTGGTVELDRSVLDRMAPAFEHLLRNAVVHGIEAPNLREALGKDSAGAIEVSLRQIGNEVRVEVRDDGAGLDLPRIAERARASGLLDDSSRPTEADLANMIFRPGFTTADEVTELAGRGVGMDVVRAEVTAMGGRIETSSAAGRGTAFQLVLPLTTAVTQVVALEVGGLTVAVPSTLVELVRRVSIKEAQAAYASGLLRHGERELPFFWLGALLQHGDRGPLEGRTVRVLIIRSASQRVAVHVGEVLGNQEVVVKNLGPQLSRMPGLAGMSLMANGETVLIYNPVALAAVYGESAHHRLAALPAAQVQETGAELAPQAPVKQAPQVMVVDDSLTVRRVTQRLLQREGYRVLLARDGLEALELLGQELPDVILSDIEMPRMDGFDLVRNLRADARLRGLPVIMITSRIAQKHRDHAAELGVSHYLGKPYDEEALLSLVQGCLAARQTAVH
ncbi:MAG: Hpt domain-containing protein [Vitreoscilla sp.]|nr:Hpt domain-containing protein [Vitreoscilla sp.]